MAASKPTSSLSEKFHLLLDTLSVDLGTLIGDHRLFPLCPPELCPRRLTAVFLISGIRSLIGLTSFHPIQSFQCSTPRGNTRRYAKTYFGENQLLPGSISFSLLPTSHPMTLNDQWVRAFILLSQNFTLLMGSSPGFGSYAYDLRAIHTRFPFGCARHALRLATCINSLAHSSIGTPEWSENHRDSL